MQLFLVLLLICTHLYIAAESSQRLPEAIEVRLEDMSISADSFLDTKSVCIPIGLKEATVTHETAIAFSAAIVSTTPKYKDMFHLPMVSGSFFVDQTNADLYHWVVIDSDTAVKIFMRLDVVGETLAIDAQNYTIVGVYQTDGYFIGRMSSLPYPTFYIPLRTDRGDWIHSVFVPADSKTFQESAPEKVTELIDDAAISDAIHHAERKSFLNISKWILFSLLCFIAFLWLILRFLRAERNKLTKRRWLYVSCLLPIFITFVVLLGVIEVPASFLPEDNIFDMGYYAKLLVSLLQSVNASYDGLVLVFVNTIRILLVLDAAILILTILFLISIRQKDFNRKEVIA